MESISINQRIPISLLDMGLQAVMDGNYSKEFAIELGSAEYSGENRLKKFAQVMGRIVANNPQTPFLIEHKQEIAQALKIKSDKALIVSALINSAYSFAYDLTEVMGKYFHVQEQLATSFIMSKMSEKYSSNRSLPNAMNSVLPMMIEVGMVTRPKTGVYEICHPKPLTEISVEMYKRSFFINHPNLPADTQVELTPYWEYLN